MASKRITVIVSDEGVFFYTKEDAKMLLKPLRKLGIRGKKKIIYCG